MRWWPASAIVAVVLIEARSFVDTPSLTEELQKTPSAASVNYIDDRVLDLFLGYGFTTLGLAFVAVFVAGLVHSVTRARLYLDDRRHLRRLGYRPVGRDDAPRFGRGVNHSLRPIGKVLQIAI